jgi:O-antigen ligase
MNDNTPDVTVGWSAPRSRSRSHTTRLRDYLPPLVAVLFVLASLALFGAGQPMAALTLSALLIATAIGAAITAGPRHVTFGMAVVGSLIWSFALTGWAGNLERAAPDLAVLMAAGAVWTVGYICARRRGALDITWAGLVWGAFVYCAWMFFSHIAQSMSNQGLGSIADAFTSPTDASLLFGFLALIGSTRVLHVVKQMDAEALARAEMIGRLLSDALGGILLMGFALTCLVLAGSQAGVLLASAVILLHAWWDMRAISTRDHRGLVIKIASRIAPFAAIGLAVWGMTLGWLRDETVAPGVGLGAELPRVQRFEAYIGAFLQQPVFGHGLGSAGVIGAEATTLQNAKAMLAPGGAQNALAHWLAEAGIAGFMAMIAVLGAIHLRIVAAMGQRGAVRTFLRIAIAASLLLVLHGATDSSLDLPGVTWLYALLLGAACGVATTRSSRRSADKPI